MKKYILTVAIPLLLCSDCGKKSQEGDKHELARLLFDQQQAWNSGNLEGFMQGYYNDSSMQFITKRGVRKGWKQTLDAYRRGYKNKDSMGLLEFKLTDIEFLDEASAIGHINGTWRLLRKADTPAGHFSLITKRISGKHKIIIDHTW